jgi:hypothetical protein
MLEVAQNAIDDAKIYYGLSKICLKVVQTSLQKTIIWTKKLGKGRSEWENTILLQGC